jgi:2,5-diketo-D-gluconate reductase A
VSDQHRHVTLNNGVQMPILGFGVFQVPPDQTEQAVTDALATGYRHLDTAEAYRNEQAVGRAIATSGIPRDELFVTTKLWVQDGGEDGAKRAFGQSLARLGLDHLDLYLIHQPFGDYYSSWRAMQDLYQQGVVKAIGVANFYPDRLVDLIDHNDVTPAAGQQGRNEEWNSAGSGTAAWRSRPSGSAAWASAPASDRRQTGSRASRWSGRRWSGA